MLTTLATILFVVAIVGGLAYGWVRLQKYKDTGK